ncbi:hypothetical protein NDU88_009966 [Pleurodeles waltl]|uniref:Kisspeptin n=1 Tax=Pleurodeles waltl TaxID=8319 RepID=A0AAV7PTK3_PLEWA|nr:hypothetical protein NDU88_009966 [Pleurodeles waltl]
MRFLCSAVVLFLCCEVCFTRSISYGSELIPSNPGSVQDDDRIRTAGATDDLCSLFESIIVASLLEVENLSIQPSYRNSPTVDPWALWKDYTEGMLSIFYFLGRQKRQETAGYNVNSFGLRFGKRDTKFNWNSFGLRFGKKRQLQVPMSKVHQMLCQE